MGDQEDVAIILSPQSDIIFLYNANDYASSVLLKYCRKYTVA